MGVRRGSALALLLTGAAVANGCGTDAVDVEGCRQIEEARCRKAPECGILIERLVFTSGTDVEACVRYYDDACLHGLASSDPGQAAVNACVAAIQNKCSLVASPQTDTAACGWLVPPVATAADASDAPPSIAVAEAGAGSG